MSDEAQFDIPPDDDLFLEEEEDLSTPETPAENPATNIRPFVPLNLHTHFSLLDGATHIDDLIEIAKQSNFPACAITDNGVMYGAIEFYNAAKKAGIKPIIGCETYVIDGDITDRSTKQQMNRLVLLAKNEQGYRNLVELVTRAQLEGFYYRPRCNWDMLREYGEGLIALSADLAGPVAREVLRGNMEEARDKARLLKDIFGDDFYLEIQDHGKEAEIRFSIEACKIAKELDIELVATNDSHFSRPEDHQVQQILLCMQGGRSFNDPGRTDPYGPEYYIKNGDQMAQLFRHLEPELVERALENTLKIADKINFELEQGKSILPDFPLPENTTPDAALHELVHQKLPERYSEITEEIKTRAKFELDIIAQMGFPAYFLIVADFIDFARKENIPVGPGSGSAAGSIVAYALGITDIDPLEHNLLFERFLNPERVSMPDIDIDFCIDNRERVIKYVTEKYGNERVSQIITFGTLAARAALKAVARVMDVPFSESDKLAKMIPGMPGTQLADALKDGMPLKKEYDTNPQTKQLVDLALKMEGTACNVGVHAAGVVISKDPLHKVVPLQFSKEKQLVAQFPMGDLEKLGLLKMDFLGLRNLTIIENTIKLVGKTKNEHIDIRNLPLDDPKVYEILTSGETDGIFQLESGGMKALVKDLKPNTFEDIGALVALYRPGPLNSGMVKQFVDRKHGREKVSFKHPALEPILKDTYGTIVYQEQIMQIAQSLSGYTLGQADLLRRAMGKKKAEVMEQEREGFLKGAVANNVDETLANELFNTMSEFAAYCFNRSHSAAYAAVAYQTAYLKAHHPVEYLSALLSSVSDLEKIMYYILTARKLGIKVLPPDVNKSGIEFTPDGDDIRFGMASIKNVGVGVVEEILKAREAGEFKSLEDFLERITDQKILNRKTLESLILSGAFSAFGLSRKQLFNNLESLTSFASKAQKQRETGQVDLFKAMGMAGADSEDSFSGLSLGSDTSEYTDEEIQKAEKSLLGFYVSSHPLDNVRDTLPLMVSHQVIDLPETPDGKEVLIAGLVSGLQKKMTKKDRPIWIGVLEDLSGSTEFVMFSDCIERLGDRVEEGLKMRINGKLQFRGDDGGSHSVIVNDVAPLDLITPINVFFEALVPTMQDIHYIRQVLTADTGPNPVILNFPDGTRIKTGPNFWVNENREGIQAKLSDYFDGAVAVR